MNIRNYTSAIIGYEEMLMQTNSFTDSLYVAIDLCMTYMLALENQGKMPVLRHPELMPESFSEYLSIRNMLLNLIEEQSDFPEIHDACLRVSTYPNPFNPEVSFDIIAPYAFNTEICLYNIKGQFVKRINCANLRKGKNTTVWDARDENNRNVGSGIYLYRIKTPEGFVSGKISLVK